MAADASTAVTQLTDLSDFCRSHALTALTGLAQPFMAACAACDFSLLAAIRDALSLDASSGERRCEGFRKDQAHATPIMVEHNICLLLLGVWTSCWSLGFLVVFLVAVLRVGFSCSSGVLWMLSSWSPRERHGLHHLSFISLCCCTEVRSGLLSLAAWSWSTSSHRDMVVVMAMMILMLHTVSSSQAVAAA